MWVSGNHHMGQCSIPLCHAQCYSNMHNHFEVERLKAVHIVKTSHNQPHSIQPQITMEKGDLVQIHPTHNIPTSHPPMLVIQSSVTLDFTSIYNNYHFVSHLWGFSSILPR